jgi:hypothetical protein
MGQAGVNLRQDRLKDTLCSVQAGLEIIFGLVSHFGYDFFRLHQVLLYFEELS